jgi:phage terminase small subunit
MGRPRKPTALLEMSGAFDVNPERLAARLNEPTVDGDIGNPPTHLSKPEKKAWKELAKDAYWLRSTDRLALEMICRLTAKMRTTPDTFTGTETSALTALIRTLGLTPSDRSRINAPAPAKEDEWTDFLKPEKKEGATPQE